MNATTGRVGIIDAVNVSSIFGNGSSSFLNIPKPLNIAMNFMTITILFVTMISLGCTMEIHKIKAHLLEPKGVAIALVAQFCIMPLTAFALTKSLRMPPIRAVIVLICGCCPGGSLSNIFSLVVKGDMNLSIVMTTCSSIAALGLMPLLLYIFSHGFTGLEKAVPYVGIVTTLVSTLVPCAVGILINHYKPNYSAAVKKIGLVMLVLFAIIVSILSGFIFKDAILMIFMPDFISAAALMPLIGFMLGYVMSAVCKLSPKCSRTISIETGCQNLQLCTAILRVAFPPQVMGPMFLFPALYIIFQCAEVLLLALCFRYYQTVKPLAGDTGTHKHVGLQQEEVKLQGQLRRGVPDEPLCLGRRLE